MDDGSRPGTSNAGSRSASTPTSNGDGSFRAHHRRTESLWTPPHKPIFVGASDAILHHADSGRRAIHGLLPRWSPWRRNEPKVGADEEDARKKPPLGSLLAGERIISPNNIDEGIPRYNYTNAKLYAKNQVSTTKYTPITLLPRNLFEQLHRFANVYFIFVVVLNFVVKPYGYQTSFIPITVVMLVSLLKDAIEDFRRYRADRKINLSECRVWDATKGRYRNMQWRDVLVGDFVHLSVDETIPADILLLRTSDKDGKCYVETANLDGESNLKQREAARAMDKYHNAMVPLDFSPADFHYHIKCQQPTPDIYRFYGQLLSPPGCVPLSASSSVLTKDNILLRGCKVRNTDFVEGIVLYAGADTKAMLNNSGPRHKRSALERRANWDVLWCVLLLVGLCMVSALVAAAWRARYNDNSHSGEIPFILEPMRDRNSGHTFHHRKFTNATDWFIFLLWEMAWSVCSMQIMVPISLYVSVEIVKSAHAFFMSRDLRMYYEGTDKRMHCKALNIPEELGQIQYVMSDKTGTLTENQMVFRRCSVLGKDFGGRALADATAESPRVPRPSRDRALEALLTSAHRAEKPNDELCAFFFCMAICNTVVVSAKPHEDAMDASGEWRGGGPPMKTESIAGTVLTEEDAQSTTGASGSVDLPPPPPAPQPPPPPPSQSSQQQQPSRSVHFPQNGSSTMLGVVYPDEPDASMASSSASSPKLERHSTPMTDIELTDVIVDKVDENDDKKETPTAATPSSLLRGILMNVPKAIPRASLKNLGKLTGAFRRNTDQKRASTATLDATPHSYYDSESPDELALVEAAREYGVRLIARKFGRVSVHVGATNRVVRFKHLHTLPFDADRKRMSVIVQEENLLDENEPGKVFLFTKGADATMLPVISEEWKKSPRGVEILHSAERHLHEYAIDGLRTLCLGRRELGDEEYQSFRVAFEEMELLKPEAKDELMCELAKRVEANLELLGVTAIEDRLQEGVPETIERLRLAGIRVWVLTGDKVETAVNIAHSSRLFSPTANIVQLSARSPETMHEQIGLQLAFLRRRKTIMSSQGEQSTFVPRHQRSFSALTITSARTNNLPNETAVIGDDEVEATLKSAEKAPYFGEDGNLEEEDEDYEMDEREEVEEAWQDAHGQQHHPGREEDQPGLVLCAQALEHCLNEQNEAIFLRLIRKMRSVLCCRATPMQKAKLVQMAKKKMKGRVLAIGDGANDVSMIQAADVGVGLSGQEGMQAVMSCDFALARFRFLAPLLLVHGHWCYHRLAHTILYFFYKNAMFVFTVLLYLLMNGASARNPVDPIYLMFYNLIFTSLPVLTYGVLEQDASAELLLANPKFYDQGRLGKKYRRYSYWITILDAAWQATVVFLADYLIFIDSSEGLNDLSFTLCTQLVLIHNLYFLAFAHMITIPLLFAVFGTILFYFVFCFSYNQWFPTFMGFINTDAPVQTAGRLMQEPHFWALIFLTTTLALLPRFTVLALRNTYRTPRMVRKKLEERQRMKDELKSVEKVKGEPNRRRKTFVPTFASSIFARTRRRMKAGVKDASRNEMPMRPTSMMA